MNNIVEFNHYAQKIKGGERVCLPINKIHGKSAIDILNEFGNPNETLVDLEKLLKNIGISALPMDFTFLEKKLKRHILGLVLANDKNAVIYYSDKDSVHRQRFTIAHELGHICLHLKPDTNDYPYIDWRIEEEENNDHEKEANIFAGELLIPLHNLKKEYLSMTIQNSSDLAARFGTSVNAMEKRLDYLNISYYNEKGRAVIYE